ncbi:MULTISPECIES: HD domain-containing phosphohydrolase [unclassified Pannonibacter]|uniref:HD domain-containing phosphohydrolase n=1 Tax=unclassified Pannonibacter TaxID=2627228 RepID=UPI0016497259|nr:MULTISPECIES: HD domain-containing phosphohydrolase [unclassified Pannonibacter]
MAETQKLILVVDADVKVLTAFQQLLGSKFQIVTARSAVEAVAWIERNPSVAVVISSLNLPDIDGVEFLKSVTDFAPVAARIMLTADRSLEVARRAVNEANVLMHLLKPCPADEIENAIRSGLAYHNRVLKEKNLLEKTLSGSVKLLIDMLALFHTDAFRKTTVMRQQALKVAKALGLKKIWELEMAVMFSPLGEALLPREILSRYRSAKTLTDPQRELLARAPEQSRDLLRNIPQFERIAEVLYYSGRGFDGSGFPTDGPTGKDIPLHSRILKILIDLWYASPDTGVDLAAFEALNINRRQYDPALLKVVRACLLETEQSLTERSQIIACHIRALRPGDILIDDIITDGSHELVLSRGHQLTETTIKRLSQFDRLTGLRQPIRVNRQEVLFADPVSGATSAPSNTASDRSKTLSPGQGQQVHAQLDGSQQQQGMSAVTENLIG